MINAEIIMRTFARWSALGMQPANAMQAQLNSGVRGVAQVWADHLNSYDVSPEEFAQALSACESKGPKWWPSALEVKSAVPRFAVVKIDNSEEAWSIFWGMICGSPGSASLARSAAQGLPWVKGDADMDRRMKHAAQALGGPRRAGSLLEKDVGMHRASFRRAYQAVATEEDMTRQPKALPSQAAPNVLLFPSAGGDS